MTISPFEWDERKNELNKAKHGISFFEAQQAFLDPNRVIREDPEHSTNEDRFYCFGKVNDEVMTVRFTYRSHVIRIFGAGYWREGRKFYEKKKN